MADYQGTILTNKGRQLLLKALQGERIYFTKAKLGDGDWSSVSDPKQLNDLVSPKLELSLHSVEIIGDGTAKVTFVVTNQDLQHGFFTHEIGVYAQDPDEGEILYAVAYAENPDYIPTSEKVLIEEQINLYVVIGDVQNVEIVVSDSMIWATRDDVSSAVNDHNSDPNAHQTIINNINNEINNINADISQHLTDPFAHKLNILKALIFGTYHGFAYIEVTYNQDDLPIRVKAWEKPDKQTFYGQADITYDSNGELPVQIVYQLDGKTITENVTYDNDLITVVSQSEE